MSKLEADLARLYAENEELKTLLAKHGITMPRKASVEPVLSEANPALLSPGAKVKLFRRLFHGREDVCPIRWESKPQHVLTYGGS